ncbi:unnamed protein product [Rotaria sp. Silwood2]|nr:unnamed protein product [Rotaria sp. Silwood2]CAF3015029.1 unnamed protein product [Rotaria sp. Silwood2]CAF3274692.1 unnamed protein product [Rotaria sp. Silwood2]CAF3348051.1 unnamed protein product [Rotaria sp. Silwood2]CAF4056476.1 unnamed protein product [Rotaria sp. Silwood2]
MNILFVILIFIIRHFSEATIQDLSGSYDFENCACTVLRCLEKSIYRFNQSQNGDFTIYYKFNIEAAHGRAISINNGQQTQVSMRWLPGMDFDTVCNGTWIPTRRLIELKCGDQQRYCTGQFKCRYNSGPCAKNSSTSIFIQYMNSLSKIIISLLLLIFIEQINQ